MGKTLTEAQLMGILYKTNLTSTELGTVINAYADLCDRDKRLRKLLRLLRGHFAGKINEQQRGLDQMRDYDGDHEPDGHEDACYSLAAQIGRHRALLALVDAELVADTQEGPA